MATSLASGTNPYKLGSPPDFGTLYSGRALEFDGVADYVGFTRIENFTEATVALWVKTTNSSGGLINHSVGTTALTHVRYSSGLIQVVNGTNPTASIPIHDGNWHRVIILFKQNGSAADYSLFIDGVEDTAGSFPATEIGSYNDADFEKFGVSTFYFDGSMTDCQIWDKNWSLSDVQYDYTHPEKLITVNSSVTSGTTISNLKVWYPCTEGSPRSPQATIYDGSGDGNHGTTTFLGDELWDANRSTFTNGSQELQTGSEIASGALTHHKWYEITARDGIDFTTYGAPNNSVGTVFCLNHPDGSSVPTMDSNDKVFLINLNWVPYGDNTLHIDSNALKITYDDDARGAYAWFKDASDLSSDLTVGRTYRVTFDAKVGSGDSVDVTAHATGTPSVTVTETTFTSKSIDFVCSHATTNYLDTLNMASGEEIWLDNISLKEVGVATGWTTADAEPLIPQTALMGMSKPMVFDGIDDYLEVADNAAHDMGTGDFSISAWIRINDSTTNNGIITKSQSDDGTAPRWYLQVATNGTLLMNVLDASNEMEQSSTFTVHDGNWHHVVAVIDRGTGVTFYKDGGNTDSNADTDATGTVDNNGKLRVGIHVTGTLYFAGDINELAIWKDALTLAEVQAIFNDGVALDVSSDSGNYASSSNLVGYWRNDGISSWTDRSDSEVNLSTVSGSPVTALLPEGTTSGKDILGFPLTHTNNGWMNLSGLEYVKCGESSSLNVTGGLTVEAWIKTSISGDQWIIARDDNSTRAYYLILQSSSYLQMRVDSGPADAYAVGDTALNDGDWHHVVGVYIPSTSITVYIDSAVDTASGTNPETDSIPSSIESGAEEVTIGVRGDGSDTTFFDGQIDELKVYNRALSAAEITKNYKHGKSKHS